jgi:hypothetical protein
MTAVCYECHTRRTEDVRIAEDAQQEGYDAIRDGDIAKSVERYRRAAEILAQIPDLRCKHHVPPYQCAGVRGRNEFDGALVWLPSSSSSTQVTNCERCYKYRPCVDCDSVERNPAWDNARPWSGVPGWLDSIDSGPGDD